jgi:hypothetical protein
MMQDVEKRLIHFAQYDFMWEIALMLWSNIGATLEFKWFEIGHLKKKIHFIGLIKTWPTSLHLASSQLILDITNEIMGQSITTVFHLKHKILKSSQIVLFFNLKWNKFSPSTFILVKNL